MKLPTSNRTILAIFLVILVGTMLTAVALSNNSTQLDTSTEEKTILQNQVNELKEENKELGQAINSLEQKSTTEEHAKLEEKNAKLQNQMNELRQDNDKLMNQLQNIQKQNIQEKKSTMSEPKTNKPEPKPEKPEQTISDNSRVTVLEYHDNGVPKKERIKSLVGQNSYSEVEYDEEGLKVFATRYSNGERYYQEWYYDDGISPRLIIYYNMESLGGGIHDFEIYDEEGLWIVTVDYWHNGHVQAYTTWWDEAPKDKLQAIKVYAEYNSDGEHITNTCYTVEGHETTCQKHHVDTSAFLLWCQDNLELCKMVNDLLPL